MHKLTFFAAALLAVQIVYSLPTPQPVLTSCMSKKSCFTSGGGPESPPNPYADREIPDGMPPGTHYNRSGDLIVSGDVPRRPASSKIAKNHVRIENPQDSLLGPASIGYLKIEPPYPSSPTSSPERETQEEHAESSTPKSNKLWGRMKSLVIGEEPEHKDVWPYESKKSMRSTHRTKSLSTSRRSKDAASDAVGRARSMPT